MIVLCVRACSHRTKSIPPPNPSIHLDIDFPPIHPTPITKSTIHPILYFVLTEILEPFPVTPKQKHKQTENKKSQVQPVPVHPLLLINSVRQCKYKERRRVEPSRAGRLAPKCVKNKREVKHVVRHQPNREDTLPRCTTTGSTDPSIP
jgi:hypothetical protein